MASILWISRFDPNTAEVEGLKRLYGGDVRVVSTQEDNAQQMVRLYRNGGYDDLVVVAPSVTLHHVCSEGVQPLWSEMDQIGRHETPYDVRTPDGRRFRFNRLRRLRRVALDERPVERLAGGRIIWLARHEPWDQMLTELDRLNGGQRVEYRRVQNQQRGGIDPQELARRFRESGADELVLVAPWPVYDDLAKKHGVHALRAVMEGYGQSLRFIEFRRVHGIRWDLEELS